MTRICVYPVKSLRGCSVDSAEIDALGIAGDRRFLVVDESDRFLTQRVEPRMARVATALTRDMLRLSIDGHGRIEVPLRVGKAAAPLRAVTIWRSEGLLAEDCGDAVAEWLGDFLGLKCRLVRVGEEFRRPVLKSAAMPGDLIAFTDACPFMAISQASLDDLNHRVGIAGGTPVPVDRFRPTFVIGGSIAYAEDGWDRIRIGGITLRSAGPCIRCVVTTTNQLTGDRGKEPLRTLATYRRDATDPVAVRFGVNFIHETKSGFLRAGDPVQVLE